MVSSGRAGAVFFALDPPHPPIASHPVQLLHGLPKWGCLPSLNKVGISLVMNSEAEVTGHQDTEMGHIFHFPFTA